jgi:hypothetical protein
VEVIVAMMLYYKCVEWAKEVEDEDEDESEDED